MNRTAPLVIGITGNISTGKSTVARMLGKLGADVIDADRAAHTVMRRGTPEYARIVETFGPRVVAPDGEIDRRRLGEIVFADPRLLSELEAIVHPATIAAVNCQIAATDAEVVAVEAIKLIETGMSDTCDSVWVTTSDPQQQIRRAVARGLSRDEAEQRVRAQPPQSEKIARADVVIDNSGPLSATWVQVLAAWERLVGQGDATSTSGRGSRKEPARPGQCAQVDEPPADSAA